MSTLPSILCVPPFKNHKDVGDLLKHFKVIWLDDYLKNKEEHSSEIVGCVFTPSFIHVIDDDFIAGLPNLKVVSMHSAGVEGLDIAKLQKSNIRISNLPHLVAEPTADLAFALILATARRLRRNIQMLQNPNIEVRKSIMNFGLGNNVTGKTLGILGMGGIGYCVALRAVGFRMNTIYYNRNRRSVTDEASVNARYCGSLEEILKLSDFLVIALPLTKETTNLIGQNELAIMKPTAIVINVARGKIVNTDALVDALKNSTISGAGLDVTEPEPLPHDHPLVLMDNVVLSGHTGTATLETRTDMFKEVINNLKAGMSGGVMNNELFK